MLDPSLAQLVSWYLGCSDPGSSVDYLDELIKETSVANYREILDFMVNHRDFSLVALVLYGSEIAGENTTALVSYLKPHADELLGSSYGNNYREILRRCGVN